MRIGEAIIRDATKVTKAWTAHKKRVIRARGRVQWQPRARKRTIKDVASQVMPQAYAAAAGSLGMAAPRQVFYAARPLILAQIDDEKNLDSVYFTQTLLPDYIATHPAQTTSWDLLWDDRGHFREPHTHHEIGLGTLGVRKYLTGCSTRAEAGAEPIAIDPLSAAFPTHGPAHRFRHVLLIEKEGFQQLFERAGIPERYDIAIMSSKGMNTTAARTLVEQLPDVRFLVLHDFDKAGFSILGTLTRSTRRYRFRRQADVVDLGVRLEDVEEEGLEPEFVRYHGYDPAANLRENGATDDEIEYLVDGKQRVELNAFTSDHLVDWLERKFDEHGVEKVIPDASTLAAAYRRALAIHDVNRQIAQARGAARERAQHAEIPATLREQVTQLIELDPSLSWDQAVAQIAELKTS